MSGSGGEWLKMPTGSDIRDFKGEGEGAGGDDGEAGREMQEAEENNRERIRVRVWDWGIIARLGLRLGFPIIIRRGRNASAWRVFW